MNPFSRRPSISARPRLLSALLPAAAAVAGHTAVVMMQQTGAEIEASAALAVDSNDDWQEL